jgi:NADH:ubiquinone reductase (H+-translocating)
MQTASAHRVVVVGGGFGGLQAALHLRSAPVEITLVDRRNFHLFQPLTYQVATGALSPGEIAYPLRAIFKRARNVKVLMAEAHAVDAQERRLELAPVAGVPAPPSIPYDTLIVAGGSRYSYFGHDAWSEFAHEVKSLESALVTRSAILSAFEAAEMAADPELRASWLSFVVVGAGPTGVEMAGQIAELARDSLRRNFRAADPGSGRIVLVEAGDRVLASFPPSLSMRAARSLEKIGVTPLLSRTVVDVDARGVSVRGPDGEIERVAARTVVWAAGVEASPLATMLGSVADVETDRAGRLTVESDLSLAGRPEILALGDMVAVRGEDGKPVVYPGVAPVAMQQGRYAARLVRARLKGEATKPFRYHDKGNLATIGRAAAVADIKGIKLSGLLAWNTWVVVHLWYLEGFANRLFVFARWALSFVTHGRGARIITLPADYVAASVGPERRNEAGLQDAAAQRAEGHLARHAGPADG